MKAVGLLLGAAVVLAGCATRPQVHQLGLVLRDGATLEARIVERDVQAVHCPASAGQSGDVGEAVAQAISSVPGASVLLDVQVFTRPWSARSRCIQVIGHAATFE